MIKILLFKKNAKLLIAWFVVISLLLLPRSLIASPASSFQQWKSLYEQEASFSQIINFIETHPHWPSQKTLQKKAEKALTNEENVRKILQWFDKHPPLTAEGGFAYAQALTKTGQREKAKQIVKKAWVEKEINSQYLKKFLATFGHFLTSEDHKKRLSLLLYKEERAAAQEMLPFVTQGHRDIANLRLTLLSLPADEANKKLVNSVLPKKEGGVFYEHIKCLRRQNLYPQALALLAQAPVQEEKEFAEYWWKERNLLARYLIENKQYQQAVDIIKKHQLKMGESFVHAQWMIGWLQLRFLNQPQAAFEQFKKIHGLVKTPQSQSRFAFWAGEAAKALGNGQQSYQWYKKAANHKGTFYGQLAISCLQITDPSYRIENFLHKTSSTTVLKKKFSNRPFVQVLKALGADDKAKYLFFFLFKLSEEIDSPAEQGLLLELAYHLGGEYAAVETSREISKKAYILDELAYPVLVSDSYKQLLAKIGGEHFLFASLVHAIIRQESRFNPKAESYANALGLMQLKPTTAAEHEKRLKDYGLTIHIGTTLLDPKRNLSLGAIHLNHLIEEFDGNLILVLAAYNAGTGNVRKWLEIFGDPRTKKIPWLEWMELIPYYETRNYVQRVLENLVIYQYKFSTNKKACYNLEQLVTLSPKILKNKSLG